MRDATLSRSAPTLETRPAGGSSIAGREIRRRQPLPTGRAVVGGFLVALSALAVFIAWSQVTEGPTASFLVARHDLAIGSKIAAGDVALVPMDLPPSLAAQSAFSDPSAVIGSRVVGPIGKGELVQASSLVVAATRPGELEVSFAIDQSRAVGGALKSGDFVDLLATFGAGGDTYTTTVIQAARVLNVSGDSGSLSTGDARTIVIAVRNATEARAVVHAVNAGDVVLVRSAEPANTADQGGTYRAPAAGTRGDGAGPAGSED